MWAAVRPEKINISIEPPSQTDNVAQGIVKEIAYMGDMSIYLVQLDSGKVVRVTQPNAYRHADDAITWDQAVYFSWHAVEPGGARRMNARGIAARQRSAGIQLVLNFLQSLPPYRWTQARLVRWGFTAARRSSPFRTCGCCCSS